MRFLIFLLAFFFSFSILFAQEKKNYCPIWSFHQNNINIYGVSVGLGSFNSESKNTNTNGIKIELIGGGFIAPLASGSPSPTPEMLSLIEKDGVYSEVINGLNISLSGSVCDCKTNGIQLGLIGHLNNTVNGISGAFLMNYSEKHNGLQFSLFNESLVMKGLQFGISNNAYISKGLQIGLFNDGGDIKGIQIGLWNENDKRRLPFINWNFKG